VHLIARNDPINFELATSCRRAAQQRDPERAKRANYPMPVLGVHQPPWAPESACFRASNARQRQPAFVGVVTVAGTVAAS